MWINLICLFLLVVVVIAYYLNNGNRVIVHDIMATRSETDTMISIQVFHKDISGLVLDYNHFKSEPFDIHTAKYRLYMYDDVIKGTLEELLEYCEKDNRIIILNEGVYHKQDFVRGAIIVLKTTITTQHTN